MTMNRRAQLAATLGATIALTATIAVGAHLLALILGLAVTNLAYWAEGWNLAEDDLT